MKKSGLGKGLSALIPTAGADDDESGLTHDGVSTAATVPTPDSSFESVSVADIEPTATSHGGSSMTRAWPS